MQQFLDLENLKRAVALSATTTVLSWPRLMEAGRPAAFLSALFILFFFIAGATTAWGGCGGMGGAFPDRRRTLMGLSIALLVAGVMAPLHFFLLDGPLKAALIKIGETNRVELSFPGTLGGVLALMAWSASFETLFFRGGTMAVLARVFRRSWIAVVGSVLLRVWVTHLYLQQARPETPAFFYGVALMDGLAGSLLFVKGGLPAASLFAALMSVRHLGALL